MEKLSTILAALTVLAFYVFAIKLGYKSYKNGKISSISLIFFRFYRTIFNGLINFCGIGLYFYNNVFYNLDSNWPVIPEKLSRIKKHSKKIF